jgi:hypothetical protein
MAAPAIFMFFHSSPQACIRSRDAGGKVNGEAITFCAGVANGGVGSEGGKPGTATAAPGFAKSEGRAGGRGAKIAGCFDLPDASCASAMSVAAIKINTMMKRGAVSRRSFRPIQQAQAKAPLLSDSAGARFVVTIISHTKARADAWNRKRHG